MSDSISLSGFDEPKPITLRSKMQSTMRFGRPEYKKVLVSPEIVDLDRYDPTYNKSGIPNRRPKEGMFVNYKFKDTSTHGDTITWAVTNARVVNSTKCFEYEHYDADGNMDPITSPGGKEQMRRDDCVEKFSWDESSSSSSVIRVPYDVTIVNENMGERTSDAIKRTMFGSKKSGSRLTRKSKKKRSRITKKRRGSRYRISSRKRR